VEYYFYLNEGELIEDINKIGEISFNTFWEGEGWRIFSKLLQEGRDDIKIIDAKGNRYKPSEILDKIQKTKNKYISQ